MTIDEAIKYYSNKNVVLTEEEAESNTIAIETMRKYKKIEHIIKAEIPYKLVEIEKVVEDGDEH